VDLIGRILKSWHDVLHACGCHQTVHPGVLAGDASDHIVELLGALHVDLTVMNATVEQLGELVLGLVETWSRLRETVEAVHVSASFDERFGERQTETASAT